MKNIQRTENVFKRYLANLRGDNTRLLFNQKLFLSFSTLFAYVYIEIMRFHRMFRVVSIFSVYFRFYFESRNLFVSHKLYLSKIIANIVIVSCQRFTRFSNFHKSVFYTLCVPTKIIVPFPKNFFLQKHFLLLFYNCFVLFLGVPIHRVIFLHLILRLFCFLLQQLFLLQKKY